MDMTDRRLISEMQFGLEAGKELGEEERKAEQQRVTEHVRVLLGECGCVVADDINRLGCTGVARMFPANPITTGAELRMDLAGGGVGLPCFVPPTLFCLVHNTIGGLEDKQKAYFTDEVGKVSRALTDAEAATVAAMDRVRRMKRTDAEEFIAGRSAAEADEVAGDDGADVIDGQLSRAELDVALGRDIWSCDRGRVLTAIAGAGEFGIQRATLLRTVRMESTFLEMILNTLREEFSISLSRDADRGEVYKITAVGAVEAKRAINDVRLPDAETFQFQCAGPPSWKCEEHDKTNWECRHCVAQAVVEGSLEPGYMVAQHDLPQTSYAIRAGDMEKTIQGWNEDGVNKAYVYVQVATFTRKLSRD